MIKRLADLLLPPRARSYVSRKKHELITASAIRRWGERYGYLISRREDYYGPLSAVEDLRATEARWNRPSSMSGVACDLDAMQQTFGRLVSTYYGEFAALPAYSELQQRGFGPGFTAVDALTLYMMIRDIKPSQYVEVGSGLSTYYAALAAERNRSDGHPVQITCIEPYPYEKLQTIAGITLRQALVQDVAVDFFEILGDDDVLFIDSSHVVKIDGDVPFLFLEVLPRLRTGVHIHIHDVPFPYNVPHPADLWVFGRPWPMLWTEAMLVQALLCGSRQFRIEMSTPMLRYANEAFLRTLVPIYETVAENPNTFSSLWLEKVSE